MLSFDDAWAEKEVISRLQNKEEARGFFEELRSRRSYLEIGSRRGFSLWLAAAALAPRAHLYAIDLPDGPWGEPSGWLGLCAMSDEIGKRFDHDVRVFLGNSHDAEALKWSTRALNDNKVDALFLDGDHSFDGVAKDFVNYVPLVKPDGIVALHDVAASHDPRIEVRTFWRYIKSKPDFAGWEYIDEQAEHPLGIGCMHGAEAARLLPIVATLRERVVA